MDKSHVPRPLNPLHNFFLPSQKLLRKIRIGFQIKKEYIEPQTPCVRILANEGLSEARKADLNTRLVNLNPVVLSDRLEEELKAFQATLRSIRKWAA